ncbi:tetraspanin-1-like [Synchiropus splendidus]|uniref:tetraspanin-1-like n=1 Tax=Synchiropus splendidus TaxID=270530 RepID=UPI00237D5B24|nr:tetraspanin-1-like [Synchiropus splendidus]
MCCAGFLKMMMFLFNGIIFLAGAAILAVGIWFRVDGESLLGLVNSIPGAPSELSLLANISYLLIGVGAFLLIIGFLGCCGAITESRCMLLTFFCIVLILFLAEVAGAVVLLAFNGVVEDALKTVEVKVVNSIKGKYGADADFTQFWDVTMDKLSCCGYTNYTDFEGSPFNRNGSIPSPCCTGTSDMCAEANAMESNVNGCYYRLLALIEENTPIVAGVALGVAALEIAAMTVSMILYKKIGADARQK